jgi:GTP-binding protein
VAADARTILTELAAYSPALAEKPRVTVLNKIDALLPEEITEKQAALAAETGSPVLLMSGVSREGVTDVLRALWTRIAPSRQPAPEKDGGSRDGGSWQP